MNPAPIDLISALERECAGRLSFVFYDLENRRVQASHADDLTATASTYKLPLLIHAALEVHEGKAHWIERLRLTEALKSRGTGVLQFMAPGLEPTLHDLCHLMVALSDNTATDMLIERFGIEATNARLRALGFPITRLLRQDLETGAGMRAPLATGVTTAREMANLLRGLVMGTLLPAAATADALVMLSAQSDRSMIARYLPMGWSYAGKTGCDSDLRADVGLIRDPEGRAFILAAFCTVPASADWSIEHPGSLAIAKLARLLLAFKITAPATSLGASD